MRSDFELDSDMTHFALDPDMTDADWEAAAKLARLQRERDRKEHNAAVANVVSEL